jgi:hypothetical protein
MCVTGVSHVAVMTCHTCARQFSVIHLHFYQSSAKAYTLRNAKVPPFSTSHLTLPFYTPLSPTLPVCLTQWQLLIFQLYHTSACPQEAYSFVDENGVFSMRSEHMKAYVGDDGSIHLVANRETLKEQINSLDLSRARMLTKASRALLLKSAVTVAHSH